MDTILYSRDRDGNLPVHILDDGRYELHRPEGLATFDTARQLLIALTGHPEARHWTFDRYFRQGTFLTPDALVEPIIPVLDILEPGGIVLDSGLVTPISVITSESLTIHPGSIPARLELETFPAGDLPKDLELGPTPVKLGIDLGKRGHEVAKLLFAGFKSWIFSAGYDPQDVLQEVYKGILIRNQGTCPFDARKASFGHYVHQVCHCVLSNYHRRETRRTSSEQTGMTTMKDGDRKEVDVSEALADVPAKDPRHVSTMEHDILRVLSRRDTPEHLLAARIVPLLGQGYTQGDLSDHLRVSRTAVSHAIELIRAVADHCGYRKK